MNSSQPCAGYLRCKLLLVVACATLVLVLDLTSPAVALDLRKSVEEAVKGLGGSSNSLSNQEIGDGLIEALRVGTERVVGQVGAVDGYNLAGIKATPYLITPE